MENMQTLNPDIVRLATPVLAEYGFTSIQDLVVDQVSMMLQAKIDRYETENRMYEMRYGQKYEEALAGQSQTGNENFELDDELNDWRFAREAAALYRGKMLELRNA